ncbi:MAG: hypothetical protein C4316_01945 [Chloroflexota bacterium]
MHPGLNPKPATNAPRARLKRALGLIVAALLAGCQLSPAPGFRGVVKVGLVAPFSGPDWATGYEALLGTRAAVNLWNAQDRGQGYFAQLVAQDDRSTAEFGRLQAEKLAADPTVVAVVGHPTWPSLSGALPVYRRTGLPVVNYWVPAVPTDGPVYFLAPPWSRFEAQAAEFFRGRAARLLVGFEPNMCPWVGPGHGLGGGMPVDYAGIMPGLGGPIPVPEGAGLLLCTDGSTAARWVGPWVAQGGLAGVLLGPPAYSPGLRGLLGPVPATVLVPAWEMDPGERRTFEAALREAGGGEPGPVAAAAYRAAWVVLEAVAQVAGKEAGPTRDGVRQALDRAVADAARRVSVGFFDTRR